jgi:hypothetical protein
MLRGRQMRALAGWIAAFLMGIFVRGWLDQWIWQAQNAALEQKV